MLKRRDTEDMDIERLISIHNRRAQEAIDREDIAEANYQYGWVDALTAVLEVQRES